MDSSVFCTWRVAVLQKNNGVLFKGTRHWQPAVCFHVAMLPRSIIWLLLALPM